MSYLGTYMAMAAALWYALLEAVVTIIAPKFYQTKELLRGFDVVCTRRCC